MYNEHIYNAYNYASQASIHTRTHTHTISLKSIFIKSPEMKWCWHLHEAWLNFESFIIMLSNKVNLFLVFIWCVIATRAATEIEGKQSQIMIIEVTWFLVRIAPKPCQMSRTTGLSKFLQKMKWPEWSKRKLFTPDIDLLVRGYDTIDITLCVCAYFSSTPVHALVWWFYSYSQNKWFFCWNITTWNCH